MAQKETGFGTAFVIVTGITVWAADIFWRLVDDRCVSLAKWFERWVITSH
jgi:hypothetical protein